MFYPDDVVEQVRDQNDIVDVIGSYVSLSKKGTTYFGLCPFHGEKTPSFSVSPRNQMFYCFGCHKGGNVFSFVQSIESMTFPEALKMLADRAHIVLPEVEQTEKDRQRAEKKQRYINAATEAARYYREKLTKSPEGAQARSYLRSRMITDQNALRFGLGYSPVTRDGLYTYLRGKGFTREDMEGAALLSTASDEPYDRFFNRLMFPIFDVSGHVIAFGGRVMGQGEPKYLNSPDSALFNKRQNLYMIHLAKKSKRGYCILAEGYMDVLSLHQAGFDNAVASLGTALTENQARLLKRFFHLAYLCYDSDKAGTNAAKRAIPILRAAGLNVKVIRVTGAKDPDELIKTKGPEAFEECIQNAYDEQDFMRLALSEEFSGGGIEDKVRILNGMKDSLAQITDDTERELRVRDQAAKLGVSADSMLKEVNELRRQTGLLNHQSVDSLNFSQYHINAKSRADEMIISALIQRPDLYKALRPYVKKEDFDPQSPCKDLAAKLLDLFKSSADTALEDPEKQKEEITHLINSYTDPDDMSLIASLLSNELPPKEELGSHLTQIVKAFLQQALERLNKTLPADDADYIAISQEKINKKKEIEQVCITI